jgi:spore coat protein A
MSLSRRDLLRYTVYGAFGLSVAGTIAPATLLTSIANAEQFSVPLPIPPELRGSNITLRAAVANVPILPGAPTRMWTFNGSFPGPTIRRPSGRPTRVTFVHDLPVEAGSLTIHHHGSHSASKHDGLPGRNVIKPGMSRTYVYEHSEDGGPERAAMQWYHDHSHGRTSFNSWMGLGGLFILDDDVEDALPLPRGNYEIPLFLTDRNFDDDNQLSTDIFSLSPAEREVSGETYLVNGAHRPYAVVEPRRYRLRLHNGSGLRLYNLVLVARDGLVPMTQIGTESGLLPASVDRQAVLLGPAERADVVVDFADFAGHTVLLDSMARPVGTVGDPSALPPGGLLEFRVGRSVSVPDQGAPPAKPRELPAWAGQAGRVPNRIWSFGTGIDPATGSRAHTINGLPFNHTRVDARVELDSVETWLLLNATTQSHYIHIHDVDWLVLERNGQPPAAYEAGMKETFRLDPGEYILVAAKFTDHLGQYMIHCHMLDHEDGGMMAAWEVVEPGSGTATTLTADEQQRVDRILSAGQATPGRPAPLSLLEDPTPVRSHLGHHGG